MALFKNIIAIFGPRSLDELGTEFNDLPDLMFKQIFDKLTQDEIMKLRQVSNFWNNFILQSYKLKLKVTKENWESVTQIDTSLIDMDICEFQMEHMPLNTNQLNYGQLGFFRNVRSLATDRIAPETLYHILCLTQNLETLTIKYFNNPRISEGDWEWAKDFKLGAIVGAGWLSNLKTFKFSCNAEHAESVYLKFIRRLLKFSPISNNEQEVSFNSPVPIPGFFPPNSFQYGHGVEVDPTRKAFVSQFIEDHKETLKTFSFISKEEDFRIKFLLDYNQQATNPGSLQIQHMSTEGHLQLTDNIAPGLPFWLLRIFISTQISMKTLKIGQHISVHPHVAYQNLLHLEIFPNNSNTLTKVELYTHVVDPEVQPLVWLGSTFAQLESLRSLCLRSNPLPMEHHGIINQIHLLPPTVVELTTNLCLTFDFSWCPLDPIHVQNVFPNLQILKLESAPWFSFQGTLVSTITLHLVEFLKNFQNLKWHIE